MWAYRPLADRKNCDDQVVPGTTWSTRWRWGRCVADCYRGRSSGGETTEQPVAYEGVQETSHGAVGHAGVALQLLALRVVGAGGFSQRPTVGADLIEHRGAIGCPGILQCVQLDAADCWDHRLGETVAHRDQGRLDLAGHHRFMRDLRCRFRNGQATLDFAAGLASHKFAGFQRFFQAHP